MLQSRVLLAALSLAAIACAHPQGGPADVVNSQLITEDEIERSQTVTAYEAVQKLRSSFLTYRGETSLDKSKSQPYPTVYVDGQRFGPIGSLLSIPALDVESIRLYRSWDATTKFGSGNMGGVIAVTTRH
jgi:outer membrane receptor protein involved in Fe transport